MIPIHGPTKRIHQLFTKTDKSFEETMRGIKNLQKNKAEFEIQIIYILWRENYLYLKNYLEFLLNQKLLTVRIANLLPVGRAALNYQKLSIPLLKIKQALKEIKDFIPYFREITLEDPPFCLIDESLQGKNVFSKHKL